MKVSAYFYDKYTAESVWIAVMLWPLYFLPFYFFYKDNSNSVILAAIASLILASFTALIFANTLIEYTIFFLGFGILLFGSMAMIDPSKRSAKLMILGVSISVFASLILYLLRTKLYDRKKIPSSDGYVNFKDKTYWAWTIFQAILYVYVLWYMNKNK